MSDGHSTQIHNVWNNSIPIIAMTLGNIWPGAIWINWINVCILSEHKSQYGAEFLSSTTKFILIN